MPTQYSKPEGSNQQMSLHTRYLCREILCYIFSSYFTIIFLYNAFLGSKGMQRNFVWDHFIVFLHQLCSAQQWHLLEMSRGARGWQVSWTILYSKTLRFCFGSFFNLTSQHSLHLNNKWHPFISIKLGIWNFMCTSLSLGAEAQKCLLWVVVGVFRGFCCPNLGTLLAFGQMGVPPPMFGLIWVSP